MRYWLVKSEPEVYSIDHLKKDKATLWTGVRNYQARNLLRQMKPGDPVLFYHSNSEPPGVAGSAKVSKSAAPDPTQFDRKDEGFDPKADKETPRWYAPELRFTKKFKQVVPLARLKQEKALLKMTLLQRGSRLSVHELTGDEYERICRLAA